jgi:GntR family transcriptional regulator / MocR family aminotransferase
LTLDTAPLRGLTLQAQVFEQVRAMILDGRLRGGDSLPAIRELSLQLRIARNTVTLAYDRLAAEGYIESRRSIGTFVSCDIPDRALQATVPVAAALPADPALSDTGPARRARLAVPSPRLRVRVAIDFCPGRPDPQLFPLKSWTRCITGRLRHGGCALGDERDPTGLLELRTAIAIHIRLARGIIADPGQIFIMGGTQAGLDAVARLLVAPLTAVVLESPCQGEAARLFAGTGAKVHHVPVDGSGIITARLPDVHGAVAVVSPSHHFPFGVTLPMDRRLALLAWAQAREATIVETDHAGDFRYSGSPLTALKGLDGSGRVIYLGSFAQCLGAGLRLGYLVMPPALCESTREHLALVASVPPWLEQAALADFMASGQYERHLRRMRRAHAARRTALVDSLELHLPAGQVVSDDAGMHLAWRIPDHLPDAMTLERIAALARVGIAAMAPGPVLPAASGVCDPARHLVFGFTGLNEREIERGIEAFRAAIDAVPLPQ